MRHSSKKAEETSSEVNSSSVIENEIETPEKALEKNQEESKVVETEEQQEEGPKSRTYPRKPEPASVDLTPEISGIEVEDPKFVSTTNLEDKGSPF